MTINRVLHSPTVSVIMCTFNRAHLISESIQSCLNQTLKSWELIIIDDYSTDETGRVVGLFKDPRICFIESPHHVGRSAARNMGLRISKGEYISFLDSDDLIDPKKLATDVLLLQSNKDASAVYSSAESRDISSGVTLGKYDAVKSGDLYDDIAFYLPLIIATSQVTITRNLYETIGGFDPDLDRFEDTDFFRRISRASHWIANPEQLVVLKNHADNVLSNQNQRTIIEMIDRYVSKTEREIESCIISTKASPVGLYLHYAQAIFTQKNGVIASLYLYLELLKRKPFSFALILISILKMTKHRTSTVIKKATRWHKNESTLPLGDVK